MQDETTPLSNAAATDLILIPGESALREIPEPAELAGPEQYPAGPEDYEAPLPAPPLSAPPGPPTLTSPVRSQAARDLFEQLAEETDRPRRPARRRRSPGSAARGGRTARATVAAAVIAAVGAGGFFLLRPLFVQAKPQADSTAIKSTTPSASATGSQPSSTLTITNNANLVKAIDAPDDALPPGYQRETFTAANLGTAGGFSIGMPPNWHVANEMGHKIYLDAPNGTTYVEFDLTADVERTMVGEAQYLNGQHDYAGYQSKTAFIGAEPILGTVGAFWRFDWRGTAGEMRMDVLLFTLRSQSYTIYANGLAGPGDSNWNGHILGVVNKMLHTFKPLPG
jgi:hypothetical protein